MTAGTLDFNGLFQVEAGSTYDHVFPFVDELGATLDLVTAYEFARASFRVTEDQPGAALLTLTEQPASVLDSGGSGIDSRTGGATGLVRIVISAYDSASLSYDTPLDIALLANRIGRVHCEMVKLGTSFAGGLTPNNDVVLRLFSGDYIITGEAERL